MAYFQLTWLHPNSGESRNVRSNSWVSPLSSAARGLNSGSCWGPDCWAAGAHPRIDTCLAERIHQKSNRRADTGRQLQSVSHTRDFASGECTQWEKHYADGRTAAAGDWHLCCSNNLYTEFFNLINCHKCNFGNGASFNFCLIWFNIFIIYFCFPICFKRSWFGRLIGNFDLVPSPVKSQTYFWFKVVYLETCHA